MTTSEPGEREIELERWLDYRGFLREAMKQRGLTQRSLAEAMGRSESWVSQMLNQGRPLKTKDADQVAQILHLGEEDRLRFLATVEVQEGESQLNRDRAMAMLVSMDKAEEAEDLTEEHLYALSEWHVGGILELARCEGYRPDPRWIAATLRPQISIEKAKKTLQALIRLGRLGRDGFPAKRIVQLQTKRTIPRGRLGEAARKFHRRSRELSLATVDDFRHTERLTLASCIAMSEEGFATFRKRVEELLNQMLVEGTYQTDEPNRVYLFTADLFPVSLFSDTEYDPEDVS